MWNKQELEDFYAPYFSTQEEVKKYIKKCFNKEYTKRILLHTKWLVEIADNIERIKPGRPGLKVVFLITVAESVVKLSSRGLSEFHPWGHIKDFFQSLSQEDKVMLQDNIYRWSRSRYDSKPRLRIETIARIFYNVRNKVLHEGVYYRFSFHENENDGTEGCTITEAYIGKIKKRKKILVALTISYKSFRDVIIRTVLNRVRHCWK